jgi:hypothetical protein
LSFRQYRGFDPSGSRQLPIRRAIETNARYHSASGVVFSGFILDRRIENSKILLADLSQVECDRAVFSILLYTA